MTGSSTVLRMSVTIDPASTGRNSPASSSVSGGVTSGASTVETVATETDRATSPRARIRHHVRGRAARRAADQDHTGRQLRGQAEGVGDQPPSPGMIT